MRKDIKERMILMKHDGIKPNYAELAKQYDKIKQSGKQSTTYMI